MLLVTQRPAPRRPQPIEVNVLEKKDIMLLSPPADTPDRPPKRDGISVGGPSADARRALTVRLGEDLTRRAAPGEPKPPQGTRPSPEPRKTHMVDTEGKLPTTAEARVVPLLPRSPRSSLGWTIDAATPGVAQPMRRDAQLGARTGTGRNMGGLLFDPQGADFTLWLSRFKDEVLRNWLPPQSVALGVARGSVVVEFTVERDGVISSLRVLESSGTAALDRAAWYALTSSRLLSLPEDYGPPRLTIRITFFYGEAPPSS